MKIKIKLILLVLTLLPASLPLMGMDMPSPQEQEALQEFQKAAMLDFLRLLKEQPQEAKKLVANLEKDIHEATRQKLTELSDQEIDDALQAQPFEAFKHYLKINDSPDSSSRTNIANKLRTIPQSQKITILAHLSVDTNLRTQAILPIAAVYAAQQGADGLEEQEGDSAPQQEIDTNKKPAKKQFMVPNDHVIILPVKNAEALADDLQKKISAAKSFGSSYRMPFSNLEDKKWEASFSEEEKWIASFKKRIEEAKKKTSGVTIIGGTQADFDAGIDRDCELAIISPIILAMGIHVNQSNGQTPTNGQEPSVDEVLKTLSKNEDKEEKRCKEYKEKANGQIAIVRNFMPPTINKLFPKSPLSESPFLKQAQMLAAARARKAPATPAQTPPAK